MRPDVAQREREHFNRLAEKVGEAGSHRTTKAGLQRMQRRGRMLADVIREYDNPYVLEIGAGAGAFSHYLLEEIPDLRLLGCDISPKCIEIANDRYGRRFANARFDVSDCTELHYGADTFDCVCGCSILHHLPLESTLAECFRVLKPGRPIWFSEPNMLNPQIMIQKNIRLVGKWVQDTEDETAFFRWSMARVLRKTGFVDVCVRPFDFLHPSVPDLLVGLFGVIGKLVERIPVLNEIAGSLVIQAKKL